MRLTIRCEERYHRCNRGPENIIMKPIIKQELSYLALKKKVGKDLQQIEYHLQFILKNIIDSLKSLR